MDEDEDYEIEIQCEWCDDVFDLRLSELESARRICDMCKHPENYTPRANYQPLDRELYPGDSI